MHLDPLAFWLLVACPLSGIFSDLPHLRYLFLFSNRLSEIPAGAIEFNGNGFLFLDQNNISKIAVGAITGMILSPYLSYIWTQALRIYCTLCHQNRKECIFLDPISWTCKFTFVCKSTEAYSKSRFRNGRTSPKILRFALSFIPISWHLSFMFFTYIGIFFSLISFCSFLHITVFFPERELPNQSTAEWVASFSFPKIGRPMIYTIYIRTSI